jgi:hypothetical protein
VFRYSEKLLLPANEQLLRFAKRLIYRERFVLQNSSLQKYTRLLASKLRFV